MSISEIMSDPKVREAYLAIEASRAPVQLADDYLRAKLGGRAWECTALEEHIRDLARMHFNKPGVLEALNSMERHKSRRKMGKGGIKMLREIGATIRHFYYMGEYDDLGDGRIKFFIPLGDGATIGCGRYLKVTCRNFPGAVELVCAKYERGYRR